MGVFQKVFKIFTTLVSMKEISPQLHKILLHIKVHRIAVSLLKMRSKSCAIGYSQDGLTSKIYTVINGNGRLILIGLTAGNVSNYTVSTQIIADLPDSKVFLADK